MRLEIGMLIKTNYSDGPYRIIDIERGCTCPSYLDEIEMDDPPPQPPHLHLVCTKANGPGKAYFNNIVEETLLSLDKTYCGMKTEPDVDRIIILPQDNKHVQMSLF